MVMWSYECIMCYVVIWVYYAVYPCLPLIVHIYTYTGTIPSNIALLTGLTELNLEHVKLTGMCIVFIVYCML